MIALLGGFLAVTLPGHGIPTTAPTTVPAAGQAATPGAHAEAAHPTRNPLLAVVGASFSAGVGAGSASLAWPEDLARLLHWRVVVSADPGAGYVSVGDGLHGPFARLAAKLNLAALNPSVVLVQGGHDDIGQPLATIYTHVYDLIGDLHHEVPHARLGVLTVFASGKGPSPAALATDRTIVAAARKADPSVVVIDPLAAHWRFPRVGDDLHPTAAGDHWIAGQVAKALRTANTPA